MAGLLDGRRRRLEEVVRTTTSVHYATGEPSVPVLTMCTPDAVRLPAAVVTSGLPSPGPLFAGAGRLEQRGTSWRVVRWWRPERPTGLVAPVRDLSCLLPDPRRHLVDVPLPAPTHDGLRPADLVGRGPGLTPAGDDLVAGALVAAHATADGRLPWWRSQTRAALGTRRTTSVSQALLHHACDGYATPELAAFLVAVCTDDPTTARSRLLAVGHTSGAALAHGALHVLSTHRFLGAA